MTDLTRPIRALLAGFLAMFLVISLSATYWAVSGATTLSLRDDNPRLVETESRIMRGGLYDRHLTPLALTSATGRERVQRQYFMPAMTSAIGYYSFTYGTGGLENAYNALLAGSDTPLNLAHYLERDLLHRPQRGADLQTTFDATLQERAYTLLSPHAGAIIIMTVPDGQLLTLLSLPTYDANRLDATWDTLRNDPTTPFFNRAVQGSYQPGGMAYLLLMLSALLNQIDIDTEYTDATTPITITDDLQITCAAQPSDTALTLTEAFIYGCPAPFATLIAEIGLDRAADAFTTLPQAPLPGFEPNGSQATPTLPDDLADLLGQGEVTYSPFEIATLTAALLNRGNAPTPQLALAMRLPASEAWEALTTRPRAEPIIAAPTAQEMVNFLRQSYTALNILPADERYGGITALAYSGEGSLVWFTGFNSISGSGQVVVTVVIENSADLGLAGQIGGSLLSEMN